MTITYHKVDQRSPEWFQLKCGILSASEMKKIITPAKLEPAKNEECRTHLYELAAQRRTQYIEPQFQSFDMLRGQEEEIYAKALYAEKFAPIIDIGFVTNDKYGFTLGCSPDGLVGENPATGGGIQCKSRLQKYQMETILKDGQLPEFMLQIQTELLVTERKWWDFISYSNGMNMAVYRCYPDVKIQTAILAAAALFHEQLEANLAVYDNKLTNPDIRIIPVERRLPPGEMKPTEEDA